MTRPRYDVAQSRNRIHTTTLLHGCAHVRLSGPCRGRIAGSLRTGVRTSHYSSIFIRPWHRYVCACGHRQGQELSVLCDWTGWRGQEGDSAGHERAVECFGLWVPCIPSFSRESMRLFFLHGREPTCTRQYICTRAHTSGSLGPVVRERECGPPRRLYSSRCDLVMDLCVCASIGRRMDASSCRDAPGSRQNCVVLRGHARLVAVPCRGSFVGLDRCGHIAGMQERNRRQHAANGNIPRGAQ